MTTFRPFGPSVTLTALLSSSTPRSRRSRASVENLISLAAMIFRPVRAWGIECSGLARSGDLLGRHVDLFDDAHDVGLLHDQKVLAVDLDLVSGPFAEEDRIARLDVERDERTALVAGAGTDGNHLALLRLFLGCIGNDDPTFGFGVTFRAPDDDAVVEWTEFH